MKFPIKLHNGKTLYSPKDCIGLKIARDDGLQYKIVSYDNRSFTVRYIRIPPNDILLPDSLGENIIEDILTGRLNRRIDNDSNNKTIEALRA